MIKTLPIAALLLFCLVGIAPAQTPRLFLVPRGTDPVTTSPGVPAQVEVVGGSQLIIDVYVEIDGGTLSVTGAQFEMPCEVSPANGMPMNYLTDSVVSDGFDFAGGCDANWVDQRSAGSCPNSLPGALAAGPSNSPCNLSGPELIGSITYSVPTTAPTPNLFQVVPTLAILADQNQNPLGGLVVDGLNVSVCTTCPAVPAASSWTLTALVILITISATIILQSRRCLVFDSQTLSPGMYRRPMGGRQTSNERR